MPSIQVNWSRLHEQGIEPKAITKLVESWERAGFKVYGQAQDVKDLTILQRMADPERPKAPANNAYQLACCFLLGAFSSLLGVLVVWWNLMVR
jgi:hypothetical protein